MFSEQHAEKLLEQVNKITSLLAVIATDGKPHSEKVMILLQTGLSTQEISVMLGITPNAVRLVKHKINKGGKVQLSI